MSASARELAATGEKPRRLTAATIAIWTFAVAEAVGIGLMLWNY